MAELDVLASLAELAVQHAYVRPTVTEEPILEIHEGRIRLDSTLPKGTFVPNDTMNRVGARLRSPDYGPQHGGQKYVHSTIRIAGRISPNRQFRAGPQSKRSELQIDSLHV